MPNPDPNPSDPRPWRQRARVAGGIALICLLFIAETWTASRITPHPATPFIQALLGATAVAASGAAVAWSARARRLQRAARDAPVDGPRT